MKSSQIFEVYEDEKGRLYTKSDKSYFGERTVREKGELYREWDPKRSKLAAAIKKKCANVYIRRDSVVLYLGAAHGYTVSYVSDIARDGFIFALDFAPRVVRDLVFISKGKSNIAPMMFSASQPQEYIDKVSEVDTVFQDIAQKGQAEIFMKNCELFLKSGGYGLLALKARSVDVTKKPVKVFRDVRDKLEQKMVVTDFKTLDPYEKDHGFFICKKR